MELLPGERQALADFVSWVRSRFGARVRQLALFGSRARGEGDEDSDLDVLVIIDELRGPEAREIGQTSGDAMTHHDVRLVPLALSTARLEELRARERLIARELDRDAVAL